MPTLKERVEDHLGVFFLGALLTGFLAGIAAYGGVLSMSNQTTIAKATLAQLQNANGVLKNDNNDLKKENGDLIVELERMQEAGNGILRGKTCVTCPNGVFAEGSNLDGDQYVEHSGLGSLCIDDYDISQGKTYVHFTLDGVFWPGNKRDNWGVEVSSYKAGCK